MEKSKAAPAQKGAVNMTSGRSNRAILLIAALDMSWRLAIVVLVPIIGGFELDKHWNIAPALTITGFLLAMIGVFVILKRTMAAANEKFKTRTTKQ